MPFERLEGLKLIKLGLTEVPSFVGKISSLTMLVLEDNAITTIKEEDFAGLTHLRSLGISNNETIKVGSLSHLTSLQQLRITNNPMTEFPAIPDNLQ